MHGPVHMELIFVSYHTTKYDQMGPTSFRQAHQKNTSRNWGNGALHQQISAQTSVFQKTTGRELNRILRPEQILAQAYEG